MSTLFSSSGPGLLDDAEIEELFRGAGFECLLWHDQRRRWASAVKCGEQPNSSKLRDPSPDRIATPN